MRRCSVTSGQIVSPSPGVNSEQRTAEMPLALAVGLLLFAVYLLGYRGGFHSADEVSMFAVGESLVKFARFDADQVAWTQWVTTQREAQGFFGVDGHVYSKKGLGLSLFVAPLYWLALQIPGIGLLQTALLLNPLLTALTASFLWLYVRRLGYDRRVATVLALTYGLATIAWVYAKFLFSEPLAAFLLLVAAYFLLAYRQQGGLLYLVGAGAAVGLSVPTRANNLFVVPLYAGYLALILWQRWSRNSARWRQALVPAFCFLAPLGAAGLIILLYNALRSGNPLDTGYDLSIIQPAFLWGLYRQLLSPHHSLFLFSPVLLLSLAGWPDFIRRHRAEAGLALGSALVYALVFAAWTSGEGLSWGSRFLMCVVPFLVLPLAPLVERWWRWPLPVGGWLFLALALLSAAIQFLGVAVNVSVYLAYLNSLYPQELLEYTPLFYDFRYTPILGQLQHFTLENSDVAWWQPWGFDAPSLLALLALLALSGGGLFYLLREGRRSVAVVALNALAALLVVAFTLPRYYKSDLQYGPWDDGYTQALAVIARQGRPGDAIITVAQYHYHVPMNRYKGPLPLIGFAEDPPPLAPNAEPLLQDTLSRYGRLWFVTVGLEPAAPSNGVERWLDEHAYKASDEWLGDARLCLYATGEEAEGTTPLDVGLGPAIHLRGYRLWPTGVEAGDIVRLALVWKASGPVERDYTVFVHLLDEGGQVRAQRDSVPLGGYRPTSSWETGELLKDRYGLLLPAELPPGEYALAVGMYDSTGRRLPAQDAAGKELANGLVLLPERVVVR